MLIMLKPWWRILEWLEGRGGDGMVNESEEEHELTLRDQIIMAALVVACGVALILATMFVYY